MREPDLMTACLNTACLNTACLNTACVNTARLAACLRGARSGEPPLRGAAG